MKHLRFPNGELTQEQETLMLQAGEATGVTVQKHDNGDLSVRNLTQQQFYSLAYQVQEQWGIPFNCVQCIPEAES